MNLKIILLLVVLSISYYPIFAQNHDEVRNISVNVGGKSISGSYAIWYRENHDNSLLRPFIICEGFDPLNNQGHQSSYDQVNHPHSLLDELRGRNYDIIVLNLNNNTMAIELNAELFTSLINTINTELSNNGSNYRSNVLGISMGGLITRYALTKMEHQGLDHRVENYISYDSPHLGANVPLGIQHMMDRYIGFFIESLQAVSVLNNLKMSDFVGQLSSMSNNLIGTDIYLFNNNLVNQLDVSAAMQMSAVYMNNNTWRQSFLNNLSSIGNFPNNCRKIGIAMGSNGIHQGYNGGVSLLHYANATKLINRTVNLPWIGSVGIQWTPLEISARVNSTNGNPNNETFKSTTKIQPLPFLGKISSNTTYLEQHHDQLVSPSNTNLDNTPGAYIELPIGDLSDWLNGTVSIPIKVNKSFCLRVPFVGNVCRNFTLIDQTIDIERKAIFGTLSNGTVFRDPRFSFVPTLSALAINDHSNWFANISSLQPYPDNKQATPFDAICFADGNEFHAQMPRAPKINTFLRDEIIPEHLYIQDRVFANSYSNTFEANRISIGRNVDPNNKRNKIGDVISNSNTDIHFRVPSGGRIELNSGCNLQGNITLTADVNFVINPFDSPEVEPSLPPIYNDTLTPPSYEIPEVEIIMSDSLTITDFVYDNNRTSNNTSYNLGNLETVIEIYPNPVVNNLNVYMQIANNTQLKIDILTVQGVIIENVVDNVYDAGFYNEVFNPVNLESGLYLCRIQYDKNVKIVKFIKE